MVGCWLAECAESFAFHDISGGNGTPMGLGIAMPFCRTCRRFRIPLARCRQVYGKLTGLRDTCEMLGRCLPSAWEMLAISEARVCLHRENSDATPMVHETMRCWEEMRISKDVFRLVLQGCVFFHGHHEIDGDLHFSNIFRYQNLHFSMIFHASKIHFSIGLAKSS